MPQAKKCGAPCIINTAIGNNMVFCGEPAGHSGYKHSRQVTGLPELSKTALIEWHYLGIARFGQSGPSPAPPMSERCGEWLSIKILPRLIPHGTPIGRSTSLMGAHERFFVENSIGPTSRFSCDQKVGHSGEHMRCGTFEPLGIVWEIRW
jgi:hypothetical protein